MSGRLHPETAARVTVLLLAIALGAAGLVSSGQIFTRAYLGMTHRSLTVMQVEPGGPAADAGIRAGDRILAVNGIPDSATAECRLELRSTNAGEPVRLLVESPGGAPRMAELAGAAPGPTEIAFRFMFATAGLVSLAIGSLIAFQRPERLTMVFFGICFTIAFFLREPPILDSPVARQLHETLYNLFTILLPAFAVHFFLLFPNRPSSRRRWLEPLIYLPAVLIAVLLIAPISSGGQSRAAALHRDTLNREVTTLYFIAYGALAVGLFVRSFRRTRGEHERARLRAALYGTLLGLLPIVVTSILANVLPSAVPILRFSAIALLLIPAAFAYAAFRHRVFDTEILVKRSVLYSLLTALLIAIYFGLVLGLGAVLHRLTGASNPLLSVVSVVVIALIAAPARARLQRLVDRLFYRERYDARATLRRFSHDLARMLSLDDIATLLVERVVEVLALRSGVLFVRTRHDEPFTPMHATPAAPLLPDVLPEVLPALSARGVDLFAPVEGSPEGGRARPLRLDLRGDPGRLAVLSDEDRRAITRHHPDAAVPLWGREHLLGVLLLGAPRSGTPIAQEDLDLLETLGEQAAIAIENALLHKSEIQRERMVQELRVARGIQAHLVPDREPKSDAVEFAGTTVASHEIGGDFYDYVPLADRKIGIAIGDVAGKGIPAALLMAGLQSSFRIEAERGRRPADVLSTLNHRIHSVGERDRFVCFFYGLLDLPSRQLVYANAGLDPPILVRASGRVERLRVGGPVLGVVPGATFNEAKVSLSAGDTLVLYTDGLVEPAEVRSGFGEADLVDFLVANRTESPVKLRELTLARLVELAGEMSYDDTTLIVARAR
jgi:phosphoserine phosphatase RsbU/P